MSKTEDEMKKESDERLNHIINELQRNPDYYQVDIEYEYTPFETALKDFYDTYWEFFLSNGYDFQFSISLMLVIHTMNKIESYSYDEDFFRPMELLTYYLGKAISLSSDDIQKFIDNWILEFIKDNEESFIVDEYLKPFYNGEEIYHADEYYTGYDDFYEMISVYKK